MTPRRDVMARFEAFLAGYEDDFRHDLSWLPEAASIAAGAVRLDPEPAAREILEVVEEHLAPGWPDFPHRAVGAVRRRLGWGPLPPR